MLKSLFFLILGLLLCFTSVSSQNLTSGDGGICSMARHNGIERYFSPFASNFYAPIGSRDAYEKYKMYVKKSALINDDEINKACLQGRPESNNQIENAFGTDIISNCYLDTTDELVTNCIKKGTFSKYVVPWTDNATFILAVFCENESRPYWIVYSTYWILPDENKEKILKIVRGLGFDPSSTRSSIYENNCGMSFTTTRAPENTTVQLEGNASKAGPESSTSPTVIPFGKVNFTTPANSSGTEPSTEGPEWSTSHHVVDTAEPDSSTLAAGRNSVSQPEDICKKAKEVNLLFNKQTGSKLWWFNVFRSYFYAPMGSRIGYEKYKMLVKNEPLASDDEINEACFQGHPGNNTKMGKVEKVFGIEYTANCYQEQTDLVTTYCESRDYHSKYIITFTDNWSSVLAVFCENESEPYWLAFSKTPAMDHGISESVLDTVRNMGFDPNSTRTSNFRNCSLGSRSTGEANSTVAAGRNSISEPDEPICSKAKQFGRTKYVTDLTNGYYAPIGSRYAYEKYKVMHEGRSLNSDDEINETCIRGYLDGSERAYGNETKVMCAPEDSDTFVCIRNNQTTKFVITWGNENSSVTVHCDNDGSRPYWIVLSKNPALSAEEKDSILENVHAIGFDPNSTRSVSYDNCGLSSTPTEIGRSANESIFTTSGGLEWNTTPSVVSVGHNESNVDNSSLSSSQSPGRVAIGETDFTTPASSSNSQPPGSEICKKTEMNSLGQVGDEIIYLVSCTKVIQFLDIGLPGEVLNEGFTDKFYVPIGSRNAYDTYKLRFKGNSLANDHEINYACIQGHTEGLNPRIEKAFGIERTFTCSPDPDRKFATKCEGGNSTYKYFAAATDPRRTYIVAVFCEDESHPYWLAYSYNTTLSDEGKNNILRTVRFLGFDENDVRSSNYDIC